MSPDEKRAAQTLIIDELLRHQEDQPTMLVDALLLDQGFAFLHHILDRRDREAKGAAAITGRLLAGLRRPEVVEDTDKVA